MTDRAPRRLRKLLPPALVFVALVGVVVLWAHFPRGLEPTDGRRIETGMTLEQVVAVLGQRPDQEWDVTEENIGVARVLLRARPDRAASFESEFAFFVVYFQNGRVIGKMSGWNREDEPLWHQVRRWTKGDFSS